RGSGRYPCSHRWTWILCARRSSQTAGTCSSETPRPWPMGSTPTTRAPRSTLSHGTLARCPRWCGGATIAGKTPSRPSIGMWPHVAHSTPTRRCGCDRASTCRRASLSLRGRGCDRLARHEPGRLVRTVAERLVLGLAAPTQRTFDPVPCLAAAAGHDGEVATQENGAVVGKRH